jgi:hypothetical protein
MLVLLLFLLLVADGKRVVLMNNLDDTPAAH